MTGKERLLRRGFFSAQCVIYITFLYLDITGRGGYLSPAIKFLGIILCVCFLMASLWLRTGQGGTDIGLVLFALLVTSAADVCLLLADYYEWGVCFFIIVQLLYLERLSRHGMIEKKYRTALFRLLLAALAWLLLLAAGMEADALLAVTVFYFINISFNTVHAVRWAAKGGSLLFAAGMVLFLLCDINVGIYNMGFYLEGGTAFMNGVVALASIGMWFFYLPAQVLISLSAY